MIYYYDCPYAAAYMACHFGIKLFHNSKKGQEIGCEIMFPKKDQTIYREGPSTAYPNETDWYNTGEPEFFVPVKWNKDNRIYVDKSCNKFFETYKEKS